MAIIQLLYDHDDDETTAATMLVVSSTSTCFEGRWRCGCAGYGGKQSCETPTPPGQHQQYCQQQQQYMLLYLL